MHAMLEQLRLNRRRGLVRQIFFNDAAMCRIFLKGESNFFMFLMQMTCVL